MTAVGSNNRAGRPIKRIGEGELHPIVQQLRDARIAENVSQHHMSLRLNLSSNSTLSSWETGYNNPNLDNVDRYARELGLELRLVRVGTKVRGCGELPRREGFYWGSWKLKAEGTHVCRHCGGHNPAESEDAPLGEWEVMHVVVNDPDESSDEHLMVMVPGVEKWQSLEDFAWGEEVRR